MSSKLSATPSTMPIWAVSCSIGTTCQSSSAIRWACSARSAFVALITGHRFSASQIGARGSWRCRSCGADAPRNAGSACFILPVIDHIAAASGLVARACQLGCDRLSSRERLSSVVFLIRARKAGDPHSGPASDCRSLSARWPLRARHGSAELERRTWTRQ